MKGGTLPQGYTIVEVMIFLAVTGVTLLSAMALLNGQQRKTEFSQAIRDAESQIQDVINDVSTGYYTNTGDFVCSVGAGGVNISTGTNNQGTNKDCIFVGRIIQFAPDGNTDTMKVYTSVGRRQVNTGGTFQEVTNLTEAAPRVIAPTRGSPNIPDATQTLTLKYGLTASKAYYLNGSTQTGVGAVGFFTTFAQYGGATGSELASGSQNLNLVPVAGTNLGQSSQSAAAEMNTVTNLAPLNPASGVVVCFQSGGTDQYGMITIGGDNRRLSTKLDIGNGTCP